jgi:hypothetical protein
MSLAGLPEWVSELIYKGESVSACLSKGNYVFIKEYLPEIREKVNELEHLQNLNESQQVIQ